MSNRTPLPDSLMDGPFSRADALAAGVSAGRMRAADLVAPFHGVRVPASERKDLQNICSAYQRWMRRGNVFSHETAALLYRLPLPLYLTDIERIHVSTQAPSRAPEGRRIQGHRLPSHLWLTSEIVDVDPETFVPHVFPVVRPALVWAQLAGRLDIADLIALGDALLSGGDPLATLDDLREIQTLWRGQSGAKKLARASDLVRVGPLSRPESLIRLFAVWAGLPEPELNVQVADRAGHDIAMADLSWRQFRVLVEYEGDLHRSVGRFRKDITRFERYHDGGWSSLRASADDVFGDPNPFLERLSRRLVENGWQRNQLSLRHVAGARW